LSVQGPEIAFNIDAEFPPETTTAQFRLMLQSLLADRFPSGRSPERRLILSFWPFWAETEESLVSVSVAHRSV
jgi:hypothetical protein